MYYNECLQNKHIKLRTWYWIILQSWIHANLGRNHFVDPAILDATTDLYSSSHLSDVT